MGIPWSSVSRVVLKSMHFLVQHGPEYTETTETKHACGVVVVSCEGSPRPSWEVTEPVLPGLSFTRLQNPVLTYGVCAEYFNVALTVTPAKIQINVPEYCSFLMCGMCG